MYKNFFGLCENPFNVNPDPRFLYLTPQTREALDQLIYGIQNRKGFILLTGEVGTGKTTLINYLLDWLRHQKMSTAFIFNSHLSVDHLFDFILTDFGIPTDCRLKINMLMRLNTWLIERFRAGETPVLIVDEAQGLSFELLEEIRLLLNLETASEKLLQIVLAGQPELEGKLKRPQLRQLWQRIALRCNTAPLTLKECHGYITERLRIGGARGDPIFASDAMDAVHFCSQGIPRVINLLCEQALINAFTEHLRPVPAGMVEEAARDFSLDEFRPVTTRSSVRNHEPSNLVVKHSIFAKDLVRPFITGETGLHETPRTTEPARPAAFGIGGPALSADNSSVASVPERGDISPSVENSDVPVSLNDLIPALPGPDANQNESGLCWNSIACPSNSAAQLIAEMMPTPVMGSSIPPLQLIPPRGGTESSQAAVDNRLSPPKERAFTLEIMNRILRDSGRTWIRAQFRSLGTWRTRWKAIFLPAISSAARSRLSAAALRRIRQSVFLVHVLPRRWVLDFKRDWTATINAIAFPDRRKSFFRWLRQPIHSILWRQAKADPFEARRDLHHNRRRSSP